MPYSDLPCAAFLLGNIFNPNIFFPIVSCGPHDSTGVFVPRVLLFEQQEVSDDSLTFSRLMTVFTNADSRADIVRSSEYIYCTE